MSLGSHELPQFGNRNSRGQGNNGRIRLQFFTSFFNYHEHLVGFDAQYQDIGDFGRFINGIERPYSSFFKELHFILAAIVSA